MVYQISLEGKGKTPTKLLPRRFRKRATAVAFGNKHFGAKNQGFTWLVNKLFTQEEFDKRRLTFKQKILSRRLR